MRWRGRILAVAGSVAALVVVGAAPASAHTLGAGVAAMNYKTTLVADRPAVPGVSFRVVDDGLHVIATNATATPLVIDGYSDEPYLKVDRYGAWENLKSPATYLDATFEPQSVPAIANADAPPVWHRIGHSDSVIWHDHALHWMAPSPPAQVRRHPGEYNLISTWEIDARYGATDILVSGTLAWVPPGSATRWFVLLGVTAVVVGAIALWGRRRRWLPAAMLSAVVCCDVLRSVGLLEGRGGPLRLRLVALPWHGVAECLLWSLMLALGVLAARGRGLLGYGYCFCGAAVLLIDGSVSLDGLWDSQVIAAHPWWLERLLIAATAGAGAGLLVAGAAIVMFRSFPIRRELPVYP